MADNYVIDYSGQAGLYYIRTTDHKPAPPGLLAGKWTHKHMAEEIMAAWVKEQLEDGKNNGKQVKQSVRKGSNN